MFSPNSGKVVKTVLKFPLMVQMENAENKCEMLKNNTGICPSCSQVSTIV